MIKSPLAPGDVCTVDGVEYRYQLLPRDPDGPMLTAERRGAQEKKWRAIAVIPLWLAQEAVRYQDGAAKKTELIIPSGEREIRVHVTPKGPIANPEQVAEIVARWLRMQA